MPLIDTANIILQFITIDPISPDLIKAANSALQQIVEDVPHKMEPLVVDMLSSAESCIPNYKVA